MELLEKDHGTELALAVLEDMKKSDKHATGEHCKESWEDEDIPVFQITEGEIGGFKSSGGTNMSLLDSFDWYNDDLLVEAVTEVEKSIEKQKLSDSKWNRKQREEQGSDSLMIETGEIKEDRKIRALKIAQDAGINRAKKKGFEEKA